MTWSLPGACELMAARRSRTGATWERAWRVQLVSAYSITIARNAPTVDKDFRTSEFTVDVKNEQSTLDRVMLGIESSGTGTDAADPSWFTTDHLPRPIPAGVATISW